VKVVEVVERRARVGVELVDALTGGALIAPGRVRVAGAEALRASPSRWFVEDALPATARLEIEAAGYVPETIDVVVPPDTQPGAFVEVRMKPRTGYPVPPALTHAVGLVVFDDTGLPAVGADITVTPEHGGVTGAPLTTRTADDGQFLMWFLPAPGGLTPPLADGYRVAAQIIVSGVSFSGSLPTRALAPNRRDDAPVLRLTP
jgi:hypothetical protein